MQRKGYGFEFSIPDDWQEFQEDSRLVAQSSRGEELILSGHSIAGGEAAGPEENRARELLVRNYLNGMREGAGHPDLKTTEALHRGVNAQDVVFHLVRCATVSGDVVFLQALFEGRISVLLATFEGPNDAGSQLIFDEFCRGVSYA